MNKFYIFISLLFCSVPLANAQSIIVGSPDKSEERFRNEQLLGKTDSVVSFCVRPLSYTALIDEKKSDAKSKGMNLDLLPIRSVQQFNTFAPLGRVSNILFQNQDAFLKHSLRN